MLHILPKPRCQVDLLLSSKQLIWLGPRFGARFIPRFDPRNIVLVQLDFSPGQSRDYPQLKPVPTPDYYCYIDKLHQRYLVQLLYSKLHGKLPQSVIQSFTDVLGSGIQSLMNHAILDSRNNVIVPQATYMSLSLPGPLFSYCFDRIMQMGWSVNQELHFQR